MQLYISSGVSVTKANHQFIIMDRKQEKYAKTCKKDYSWEKKMFNDAKPLFLEKNSVKSQG